MDKTVRKLKRVVECYPSRDGAGVNILRLTGKQLQKEMDPFLMLDQIHSDEANDYIAGFPDHPHRGFETITYMKAGRLRHRDHMGNEGVIEAGDVQWMTAGRGVIHSEMPEQKDGLLHGFQIWLNLPADEKMKPADYRDISVEDIPVSESSRWKVKAIAGNICVKDEENLVSLQGAIQGLSTEPLLLDIELTSNAEIELEGSESHPLFAVVYNGSVNELLEATAGFYAEGRSLKLTAGERGGSVLVFSGKPIQEEIAQYGPFVMNTVEELDRALEDYRRGKLTA
ncbi:MAG: pirin family protein [Cellvibrionaceae bacterium]